MSKITCSRCCYWQMEGSGPYGEHGYCRRYTPSMMPVPIGQRPWPTTQGDDWCGQAGVPAGDWATSSLVEVARRAVRWWDASPEVGRWLNGAPEWVFSLREALERVEGSR